MREIKFRVWDGSKIIYVSHDSGFKIAFEGSDWELLQDGKVHCSSKDKLCKLMEFSGMKDNAGKDIYEGDIVKNAFDEEGFKKNFPEDFKDYGFYIGEFVGISSFEKDATWSIMHPKDNKLVIHLFCEIGSDGSLDQVKVTGNILENKDLLQTT